MGKNIENNVIINQAGENRIVLEQLSNGMWKCKELNHTCKTISQGIENLKNQADNIRNLLKEYNKEEKK